MISVHILYGGMTGGVLDAPFNPGMSSLKNRIAALPGCIVHRYFWNDWQQAGRDLYYADKANKIVLIGYSGGGSRATWIARWLRSTTIDLMVLYDPSPAAQVKEVYANVLSAINYRSLTPGMWWPGVGTLGGGVLVGPKVETIECRLHHLRVQSNEAFHRHTLAAIKALEK